MRRLLSILLILILALTAVGCKKTEINPAGTNNTTSPVTDGATTETEYVYKDTFLKNDDPNNPTVMGLFYRNIAGADIISDDPAIKEVDEKADAMLKKIEDYPDSITANGGKTYYLANDGDDKNDGLSPERPRKTFDSVKTILKSGDALLFKRGDIFRGQITLFSGVSYGAYGEGVKPRLYGSRDALEGEWIATADDPDVYEYHGVAGDYANIIFNSGEYIGRPVSSILYIKRRPLSVYLGSKITVYSPDGNPGEIFHNIEVANAYCLMKGSGGKLEDVKIQNLCLMYSGIHFLGTLGPVYGMEVEGCIMGYCGGKDLHIPNTVSLGNAIEFWSVAVDVNIHDNYFFQAYDAALTHQGPTKVNADSIQTSATNYTNIHYESNLIEYCTYDFEAFSCRNISEQSKSPNGTFNYNDVYIRNNITRYTGYGWGSLDRPDKNVYATFKYDASGDKDANGKYTNLHVKPLTIENNIFDRSRKRVLGISTPEENKANMILKNNQFIQNSRANIFGGKTLKDDYETTLKAYFGVCEGNTFKIVD